MNLKIIKKFKIVFIIVSLLLILFIFAFPGIREKIIYNFGIFINKINFSSNRNINETNQISLFEENKFLFSQLEVLKQENKNLSQELGLKPFEGKRIALKVLGEKSRLYKSVYLKTEGQVNLYQGMYVYGPDNLVVGIIDSIKDDYAQVSFLGQKENFSGEILSSGEIVELSASGIGLYYGKLPKSTALNLGETIILRGYPKAIIGTVSQIEEDSSSLNTVWIRSSVNILDKDIFYVNIE